MRTALPSPGRTQALARDKAPPPADTGYVARASTERPGSLRDAIIRWLNEEL